MKLIFLIIYILPNMIYIIYQLFILSFLAKTWKKTPKNRNIYHTNDAEENDDDDDDNCGNVSNGKISVQGIYFNHLNNEKYNRKYSNFL